MRGLFFALGPVVGCSLAILATASPVPPDSGGKRELPAPSWKARAHAQPKGMPSLGLSLVDQDAWPAEPEAPAPIDPAELGRAFRELCGPQLSRERAESYAQLFIEHGEAFGVDPFVLAALAYRQSHGAPSPRDGHRGGLITVDWAEHRAMVRDRRYHYWVPEEGQWVARSLDVGRFAFTPKELRRSEPSVYFAAALLRVYQEQCPNIDDSFSSVRHRTPISHFVWGDAVQDAGSEERILTDRRRLIQYYLHSSPPKAGRMGEVTLYCPLDGAPRKITSGLGDVRGEGHHAHRGLDFESIRDEPVRSVADGTVIYTGVAHRRLSPEQAVHFSRRRMGRGGLFILVRHTPELISAYMHLDSYVVTEGQQVKGGELLGHVGRTGIKQDPAHLHFELRRRGRAIDPTPLLAAVVFPRDATYLGQKILAAQPGMWRRVRYKRWLRRQQARRRATEAPTAHTSTTAPTGR